MTKEVDNNGFWRIRNNPLSRTGVFPYLGKQISGDLEPNKIYKVYRPMSEISAPETIESFDGIPLIDEHEMIGEGWTDYDDRPAGGVVYHTYAKDGKLFGDIRIFSEQLKDEIKNGKKELSMGYSCRYEPEQGVFDGEYYDFVQRDLRGNHVALVNRGRMGSDVRVYDQKITFDTLDGLTFEENTMEAQDREWNEADHPRDENNQKFVSKNGGSSSQKGTGTYKIENGNGYYDVIYSDGKYYAQQYIRDINGKRKDVGNQKVFNELPKEFEEVKENTVSNNEEYNRTRENNELFENYAKEKSRLLSLYREAKKEKIDTSEIERQLNDIDKQIAYIQKDQRKVDLSNKIRRNKAWIESIESDIARLPDGMQKNKHKKSVAELKSDIKEYEKELATLDEEIPSQDGSPKESGVDCSLNQQGIDSMEKVDKRKGISEVEAMLYEAKKDPAKLTDELIKTILQKMENNSYEASEKTEADDESVEACKDGCKAKDEDKEVSEEAEKTADGEAPTEEKKDEEEGKKEDTKAEDKALTALDAMPEILKGLEDIKELLKGRNENKSDTMFGLDETPVVSNEMDLGLKKYLGE